MRDIGQKREVSIHEMVNPTRKLEG